MSLTLTFFTSENNYNFFSVSVTFRAPGVLSIQARKIVEDDCC